MTRRSCVSRRSQRQNSSNQMAESTERSNRACPHQLVPALLPRPDSWGFWRKSRTKEQLSNDFEKCELEIPILPYSYPFFIQIRTLIPYYKYYVLLLVWGVFPWELKFFFTKTESCKRGRYWRQFFFWKKYEYKNIYIKGKSVAILKRESIKDFFLCVRRLQNPSESCCGSEVVVPCSFSSQSLPEKR